MPGINERLASLETKFDMKTDAIMEKFDGIEKKWDAHIEGCHTQVSGCGTRIKQIEQEVQSVTIFKNIIIKIALWALPGSGVLFLVLLYGIKEYMKKGGL